MSQAKATLMQRMAPSVQERAGCGGDDVVLRAAVQCSGAVVEKSKNILLLPSALQSTIEERPCACGG